MHWFRFLVVAAFVLGAPAGIRADDDAKKPDADRAKFELRDGDRVVFLGNTLIERAQRYGYWETMLTARYPDRDVTFRNLGWSGDTVWAESRGMFDPPEKGYERMIEHVGRLKPTVIFLGYGNNEAFAGQDGLPAFIKQYNKLLDDLTKVSAEGVRFVILSPMPHQNIGVPYPNPEASNRKLKIYWDAVLALAVQRHCHVVDFWNRLEGFQHAEDGPDYRLALTQNGLHLSEFGNLVLGNVLVEKTLGTLSYPRVELTAGGKLIKANRVTVTRLERTASGLRFNAAFETIPEPLMQGLAEDSLDRVLRITELSKGSYALQIDGRRILTQSERLWAIAAFAQIGPEVDQVERLRQAIIEKNRLYFYRWRPQNVTYLFGFRKHEQGQNAAELAEFDKLIAEKEKEIARLKKPAPHTYEIIRVEKDNDK